MLTPTTVQPLVSRFGIRRLLTAALLSCLSSTALASEPMPQVPPEKEPAAWQRAGIEAALKDPDLRVQSYALDYCVDKQWVAQFHFPTGQWMKWLALPDEGMQSLAAWAVVQLGAQTPPEVQRELLRLLKNDDLNVQTKYAFWRSLWKLGGGMIPEAQMETAAYFQKPNPDFILRQDAYDAVDRLRAAMTPAVQESLLAFIQTPEADSLAGLYAVEALTRVGTGMRPQMREKLLHLLLDADASLSLRKCAAEALGRLGAEIPPQALEFLLSVLRDPADKDFPRSTATHALARMGRQMPPEAQQALLTEYDRPLPANADDDTRRNHFMSRRQVVELLELTGPEMPLAIQQRLAAGFLKSAHAARKERLPLDGPALHALGDVQPQPDAGIIHALLAEYQDREASGDTLTALGEQFFQPLAARGALPQEVQQALLTCLQDGKAGEHARCMAAETLGRLGAGATPAIKQALLAPLQDGAKSGDLYGSAVVAMLYLGPHMPPEAAPALVGILRRNTHLRKDPFAANALSPTPDPFLQPPPPSGTVAAAAEPPPAGVHEKDTWSPLDGASLDSAVPALGNLGEKMTPEAQTALLDVIEYHPGNRQTPWAATHALAQMGDKMPPQTQQRLLALMRKHALPMEHALHLACHQTLGVSGIHPVTNAQVADLLADAYDGGPDNERRFYLYLWLGRTPAHLQAVRWLGRAENDPPPAESPSQEVLELVSRFWPHSAGADAGHAALRQAMARRTSQVVTTHLKAGLQDEPVRKVLRALATQLAEDKAPDCAAALKQVQAVLADAPKAKAQ